MKRLISLFFLLCILITVCCNILAVETEGMPWELNLEKVIATENAMYSGGRLEIKNGYAVYGFTLPIYSNNITIHTPNIGGSIKIAIDDMEETLTLSAEKNTYAFRTPLRVGAKTLYISTQGNAVITGIIFGEIKSQLAAKKDDIRLNDFEQAVQTAVIFRESSSLIMVNGATRYLDYENYATTPRYFDTSLYVPALSLARAVGCYIEQLPEKNFILLRKDNVDLIFEESGAKRCVNSGEYKDVGIKYMLYNGIYYLPVRAVCDNFEKYLLFKNGFVIIDYPTRAQAIADNIEWMDTLNNKFIKSEIQDNQTKTYYVAKSAGASDNNDGSYDAPFLTINKAAGLATEGDTVIIREGVYRETVTPTGSGTATKPIKFKAAEREKVIVSATEKITNFVQYTKNIVVASISWDLGIGRNQVFYKNKNLVEARYPNADVDEDGLVYHNFNGMKLSPEWITEGDIRVSEHDKSIATSETLLNESDNYWKDATFVSQHGEGWTFGTAVIESSAKGEIKLKDMSTSWWYEGDDKLPNFGYITNTVNAIDVPGEWAMKDNLLYIIPPKSETQDTLELEVKKRQLTFDLENNKYIWLEGITTIGGSMKMNNSEMCVIKNCNMSYLTQATRSMDFRSMFLEKFDPTDKNGAPLRGEVGIYVGGRDNAFISNEIHYSAATALYITGRYVYAENNVISNCGYMGTQSGPVHIDTEAWRDRNYPRGGHSFYCNTFYNSNRTTFNVSRYETWHANGGAITSYLPMEIAYNDFYNGGIFSLDTGIFYVWGSNMGTELLKTNMHHNRVHQYQTKGQSLVGAIYHDNFMSGMNTYDNLIYSKMQGQYRYDVYVQERSLFPLSYATINTWNNLNIGFQLDDNEPLVTTDFPGAKPFSAGSPLVEKPFMLNFENYINKNMDYVYDTKDITESEGVVIEDNLAKFTGSGQWLKLSGIDFSNGMNTINLSYRGDFYKTGDKLDVIVGDTMEKGEILRFTANAGSKSMNSSNTLKFSLFGISGKHNVYIKCSDYKSFVFEKFYLSEQDVASFDYDYNKIYAGNFGEFRKSPNYPAPNSKIDPACDSVNPIIANSWGQSWVKYAGVNIDKTVNTFKISASTGGQWSGSVVSACIGNPENEFAQVTVVETITDPNVSSWNTYPVFEAKLNKPLPEGKYDIYLKFTGDDKCSNIYWFGFE